VPAIEVMVNNARIADLLREGRSDEIEDAIADGEFLQMQTFQMALIAAVLDGKVEREVAAGAATNTHDFLVALEREEKQRVADARAQGPEPVDDPGKDSAEEEPEGDGNGVPAPEFALRAPEPRP
jgi:Tfp pilus assembly ATPase PilU